MARGGPATDLNKPADDSAQEKQLTLMEHLEELRTRLIISVGALALATMLAFVFLTPYVFRILTQPVGNIELVAIEVTENFGTYMRVALFTGVILAMPVIVYQFFLFVAPGLTQKERRYLFLALPPIVGFFLLGVAFAYFVMVPPAIQFLLAWGQEWAKPQIRISNYVDIVTKLLFWIGIAFETPIVIYALAKLGVVSPARLMRYQRHAFVVAFVVAAIITPTFDPVNQTVIALPIFLLYELGIVLAKFA